MNILKNLFLSLVLISNASAWCTELIMGTIQFPHELSDVPGIRVYCGGRKIKCETDEQMKKVSFCVPREHKQKTFHVLVTTDISYETVQLPDSTRNIISHLCVAPHNTYKLFAMKLEPKNEDDKTLQWTIEQTQLEDNRVPDNAIIVYYDPMCVEARTSGNTLELPTIVVKNDIITEQKMYELSNELLLAAMDNDALHAPIGKTTIKIENGRTLVAPTA